MIIIHIDMNINLLNCCRIVFASSSSGTLLNLFVIINIALAFKALARFKSLSFKALPTHIYIYEDMIEMMIVVLIMMEILIT